MFNVQPGASRDLMREIFPSTHTHVCPACKARYQCLDDCEGYEEIYCENCYGPEEAA
jgi:hypothetical protein